MYVIAIPPGEALPAASGLGGATVTPAPRDLVHDGRDVEVSLLSTPLELLVPLLQPEAMRAQATPARTIHIVRFLDDRTGERLMVVYRLIAEAS
jgi:hypothetical protein